MYAVENLRKYVRNAEIDNFPSIEQVREQFETTKPKELSTKGD